MGLEERAHRILTTHVGSLPRPDALSKMMVDGKAGTEPFDKAVREAVKDIVLKQAEVGLDVIDDGEQSKAGFLIYVKERLAGMEQRDDTPPGFSETREIKAFPEFYECGHSGAAHRRMMTTKPIAYVGQKQLHADLENLKAAAKHVNVADVFVPAISPSNIEASQVNRFYKDDEECLYAIGEAMREEYEAIIAAGFMLQIDDPRLAMQYMVAPSMTLADFRRWAEARIEALNHALRNISPERIRHHTCYGINMGPRTEDLEFRHVADLILKIRANYFSFEAANPRHDHEWKIWEDVKLPSGKAIMPGTITHTSVLVEHPELVAQRIQRFASVVGRENVIASADCGFASSPREKPEVHPTIVWEKFKSLSKGAQIATKALWGR
jgi:5-methyltetrahydropteroyltriglutamate--homocysteine methyltransferase